MSYTLGHIFDKIKLVLDLTISRYDTSNTIDVINVSYWQVNMYLLLKTFIIATSYIQNTDINMVKWNDVERER